MAGFGTPRTGTAIPKAHGSVSRDSDGRLDPVRWHRPARGTLLRLAAAAALLVTAAVVSWSPAQSCAPRTGAAAIPPSTRPSAAAPATNHAGPPARAPTTPGSALTGPSGRASPNSVPPEPGRVSPGPGFASTEGGGTSPGAGFTGSDQSEPTNSGTLAPGSVGVPIRLADPIGLTLVGPGDRVDLLRLDRAGTAPTTIATGATVLKITATDDPTAGGLLLALTPAQAEMAVATAPHGYAILIRPG